MDDKMRARNYYAAAVSLFQDPTADDCERAIELLNKAVDLYPDFSEASIFREEVWHCLLKSLDPNNDLGTYEKYKKSPAWHRKRDAVIQRDGGQCVCGAQATYKTYYGETVTRVIQDEFLLQNSTHTILPKTCRLYLWGDGRVIQEVPTLAWKVLTSSMLVLVYFYSVALQLVLILT